MESSVENETLTIRYDSWSDEIAVEANRLKHVATEYEFDNPVSAIPTRSHTLELLNAQFTRAEYEELVSFIRDSGFESLAPAYGAPKRHFPYVLRIGFGDERKVVTYRSNPSYEGAPEAFR